jgi:hypothetical protein
MNAFGVGLCAVGSAVYVAGVVWGLLMIDAPILPKIGLAAVWPLGPLAFAVTITILIAASVVAFPAVAAAALAAAAAAWWAFA